MKSKRLRLAFSIVLLAELTTPFLLAAQHTRYSVTFLGTLGGIFSQPFGMNNEGEVNGISTLPGDQETHAFFWRNGVMTDIGTFGGPNSNGDLGTSFGPNATGEVVGGAETFTRDPLGEDFCFLGNALVCLPFVWSRGVKVPLPTLGGYNGYAADINNRGQVIGFAENTTPDPGCFNQLQQQKPVIWENGEIHELPTFPGDTDGQGVAINDVGQAVYFSGGCQSGPTFDLHALLWQDGILTDLGSLGGTNNSVGGINNRGQVVGTSNLSGDATAHAFLWTKNTGMQDLGTLLGDFSSNARGLNEKGQVVGQSCDASGNCRAYLWQNGVMTDLNTNVPGGGSTFFMFEAFAINSRGQIVTIAFDANTNDCCAFLLTPVNGEAGSEAPNATTHGQASEIHAPADLPENVRRFLQQALDQQRGIRHFRTH